MRVLVTGDRDWKDVDYNVVALALMGAKALADDLDERLFVIEGGARGADKHVRDWVHQMDPDAEEMEVVTVKADWEKYGLAAGPIRNRKMVDEYEPDLVLAFHDDLQRSKGTKDCVEYAKSQGIPVYVIGHG